MIDYNVSKQLEEDFERYMLGFYAKFKRFSIEDFGKFAATIINYNIQNNQIDLQLKHQYAYFLTTLYNRGIGNRITEEHLHEIAKVIAADYTVDYGVIQQLFE